MDLTLKIYRAVKKNNAFIDFPVTRALITFLQKRNEHKMIIIDTIFDDSIYEIDKMQGKGIEKIKTADWILILGVYSKKEDKEMR
jgi:hypothetical protein